MKPAPSDSRPKPSRLSKPARVAVPICIGAFLATMWPIYPIFATIEPRLLGLPFSLTYLILILLATFSMMLGIFLWEDRNDELGD